MTPGECLTLKANESSGGTGGVPDREPLKLFISYSSKDRVHRETLSTFLAPLVRQGVLEVWHDRMIEPGEEWDALIATKLNEADLIMLLVSADFLNSDYCYENEMKSALARHEMPGPRGSSPSSSRRASGKTSRSLDSRCCR